MEREAHDPPAIPSIFDALRCTCGKAVGGVYCDGTHLRVAAPKACSEGKPTPPSATEPERDPRG